MNYQLIKWIKYLLLPKKMILVMCMIHSGGCQTQHDSTLSNTGTMYFSSPRQAVKQIEILLVEKNWMELTKYYDLSQSSIKRSELEGGEFFYTEERPEIAHPGGFWKYKHPFAPGFEFDSSSDTEETNVIQVTVSIDIDQGGGLTQRGIKTFLMRRSEKGYQLLPPAE